MTLFARQGWQMLEHAIETGRGGVFPRLTAGAVRQAEEVGLNALLSLIHATP